MHLDTNDEAGIAQESVLQLPKPQLQKGNVMISVNSRSAAIAFIEHHLLAVMRPAFSVGTTAKQFTYLRRCGGNPEELRVMSRINFMYGGRDDRSTIEASHVLFHLLGLPVGLRERHVKEGFFGDGLKRSGS